MQVYVDFVEGVGWCLCGEEMDDFLFQVGKELCVIDGFVVIGFVVGVVVMDEYQVEV